MNLINMANVVFAVLGGVAGWYLRGSPVPAQLRAHVDLLKSRKAECERQKAAEELASLAGKPEPKQEG